MSDVYTPEEFANKLELRGIVQCIADARKYVKGTKKEQFTEDDFEEAYRVLNAEYIGRQFIKGSHSDYKTFSGRDMYGRFWSIDMEDPYQEV